MRDELEVLKNCSHPHIMLVKELLEDDLRYYIVSELLPGGDLEDQVRFKPFTEL